MITAVFDDREKISPVAWDSFLTSHPGIAKNYQIKMARLLQGDLYAETDWTASLISFKFGDDLVKSLNSYEDQYEDRTGVRVSHLEFELLRMREWRRSKLGDFGAKKVIRLALFLCGQYDHQTLARIIGLHNDYPEFVIRVTQDRKNLMSKVDAFIRRHAFTLRAREECV